METIKYKGTKYPVRTLTFKDPAMFGGRPQTRTIADQTLFDAISKEDKYLKNGTREQKIDDQIYFYVENGQLELSGKEICEDLLDEPFEFVCDGEYEEN